MNVLKQRYGRYHNIMIIKKISILTLIGIILLVIYFLGRYSAKKIMYPQKLYSKDKVVATMTGFSLTEEDLKTRMDQDIGLYGKYSMSDEELKRYEYNFIDHITKIELLYREGMNSDIEVSNDEIDKQYNLIISELENRYKLDEESVLNKINMDQISAKNEMKMELIAQKYLSAACKISDEESMEYYNQNKGDYLEVRASHILIKDVDDKGKKFTGAKEVEAKNKAEKILERAESGEDFSNLSVKYSDDSSSKYGGDIGYFSRGEMVESFEKAAFNIEKGKVCTAIIKSDYGYHIIKKTSERYKPYDEVKNDIINNLYYKKQDNLIKELKTKYNLNIIDEYNYKK